MAAAFESDFDDPRPLSWADAFPWLAGASGRSGVHWWREGINDTDPATRRIRLATIAELAIKRLSRWTIGQIFPGLPPDVDLMELPLPTRAQNALSRFGQGGCTTGQLMNVSLDDMLDWRAVGVGTLEALLQTLADISTSTATPAVTTASTDESMPAATSSDEVRLPEWKSSVVDDLVLIARWYSTVGLPGQPLLAGEVPPGTPEDVVKARRRLEALTASSILSEPESRRDAGALLDEALGRLDSRALEVLRDRLFADDPLTLDQVAQMHGVTGERIRQIEGKARGIVLSGISSDTQLIAAVAASARDLIGTIRPLNDLLGLIPALGRTVERVRQSVWRVLDRLDDAYEIEEGWCVAPTLKAARTYTQTFLSERADQYGVVSIEELDLIESSHPESRAALTVQWLAECGYITNGGRVLTRTSSVGDYAAAILSLHGEPMSAQEIVDRFHFGRTTSSLKTAMSADDRFERVDRDRWALREWGMEAYGNIRSLIRRELAKSGGAIAVDTLVERITGTYSVSSNSVISYASTPPFELRGGIVRATSRSRETRKRPEDTSRLYRRAAAWIYRVRISHDHFRGSGSVAPVAITSILNMSCGDKLQLASDLGVQAINWTGMQPTFGSIRRYLIEDDVAAGTEAFLVIGDDRRFSFEMIPELAGNPLADALALVGAPTTLDVDSARRALAASICLPEDSPVVTIIGAYRDRGDGDVADLLMAVRQHMETREPISPLPPDAEVADIMDLL